MKKLSIQRADAVALGILVLLGVLGAYATSLLLPSRREGALSRDPSSFYNVGHGTKALYLALERLDAPAARLRRPIGPAELAGASALVLLEPWVPYAEEEVAALLDWISAGNRALIVPGGPPAPGGEGASGPRASGAEEGPPGGAEGERPERAAQDTSVLPVEWFRFRRGADGEDDRLAEPRRAARDRDGVVASRDPVLEGVRALSAPRGFRFEPGEMVRGPLARDSVEELWVDSGGVLLARVHHGRGALLALADPFPLTNGGISREDNDLLAANLVRDLTGADPERPILFDEYHLGFVQRDASGVAILKLMLAERWGWALGQAMLAGLLALALLGPRFGRPRPIRPGTRRAHQELARAAGRLLERARDRAELERSLLERRRREICRLLRLPPDASDELISQALETQVSADVRPSLQAISRLGSGAGLDRAECLRVHQTLHRASEALRHGDR